MKNNYCVHEQEIMGALRKGSLPEDLSRHLSECDRCHQFFEIMMLIRVESSCATGEAKLPSADFLWWKSQLQKRHRRAERATRSIAVMEIITPLLLILILIPAVFYLNYTSGRASLPGIGWAVIIFAVLVTCGSVAFYWHSAKKNIHQHSSTHPGR